MDKKTGETPVGKTPVPEPENPQQDRVHEADDRSWQPLVERSKKPVAVMFYSPSCTFCHLMEPHFRSYAKEYNEAVQFVRINVISSRWISERYGVRSVPAFLFFCEGRLVRQIAGAVYPAILKKTIDDVLLHGKECAKNSTAVDYEIPGYG